MVSWGLQACELHRVPSSWHDEFKWIQRMGTHESLLSTILRLAWNASIYLICRVRNSNLHGGPLRLVKECYMIPVRELLNNRRVLKRDILNYIILLTYDQLCHLTASDIILGSISSPHSFAIGTILQGNETISLQALDSARITFDEGKKDNSIDNPIIQPSSQEIPQEYKPKLNHGPQANQEITHFKEKSDPHEVQPEELPEELVGTLNHFKIGDQVLLDKPDPYITSTDLRVKGEILLKVHDIFPPETVEVSRSHGLTHDCAHGRVDHQNRHTDRSKAVQVSPPTP
ncbi:receptor-like protein kinase FERONIA [Gossypium australe]|uniref:Receptor-like protein kinase FERONIA n=1 Tax=Gossypium australe TaxID=47621 RepID=A0A5B6VF48_9ROSI|nr:receptor-like protein kinase FERONIA [Gossypium australe]